MEAVRILERQPDVRELGHGVVQRGHEPAEFVGEHHAGGVADGDDAGAGFDPGADDLGEEFEFGAGGVVKRELDVLADLAAGGHLGFDHFQHDRRLLVELVLHLDRGHRRDDVQARAFRGAKCLPGIRQKSRIKADRADKNTARHKGSKSMKEDDVAFSVDNGSRFDGVHVQLVQLARHFDLFLEAQGTAIARGLFAQRHVDDLDSFHLRLLT